MQIKIIKTNNIYDVIGYNKNSDRYIVEKNKEKYTIHSSLVENNITDTANDYNIQQLNIIH